MKLYTTNTHNQSYGLEYYETQEIKWEGICARMDRCHNVLVIFLQKQIEEQYISYEHSGTEIKESKKEIKGSKPEYRELIPEISTR